MTLRYRVVVIGAGGHAKSVLDVIHEHGGWDIVGLTDSDPTSRLVGGCVVLGTDDVLAKSRREGATHVIVAIGHNQDRRRLAARARQEGFTVATVISPAAHVSNSARLGNGIVVMPGAVIGAEVVIDDLVIVNTGASIDHDCMIGEAAHVAPGAVLAGNVRVGACTTIGVGASVIPGIEIGENVTIGAGAAVVHDLPNDVIAVGVPARIRRDSEK